MPTRASGSKAPPKIIWPDSQFDLDAHNVGDPYACITAAKSARGWQLNI
jgi:hypothetical protein